MKKRPPHRVGGRFCSQPNHSVLLNLTFAHDAIHLYNGTLLLKVSVFVNLFYTPDVWRNSGNLFNPIFVEQGISLRGFHRRTKLGRQCVQKIV